MHTIYKILKLFEYGRLARLGHGYHQSATLCTNKLEYCIKVDNKIEGARSGLHENFGVSLISLKS